MYALTNYVHVLKFIWSGSTIYLYVISTTYLMYASWLDIDLFFVYAQKPKRSTLLGHVSSTNYCNG